MNLRHPLTGKILRYTVVVLLAFLLSWFIVYDISSISYFSPIEKASDFETTDFYQIVDDGRAERRLDPDVVIVAIDDMSRGEIAEALEYLSYSRPAVVGVDIVFGYPQDGDERLVEALNDFAVVVVPDTTGYLYNRCVGMKQGSVYLDVESYRSTVRKCRTDGTFAGELVRAYRPDADLPEQMTIEYPGVEYDIIDPSELLDNPELVEGKIALVGAVGDFSDVHPTPVDDARAGILIHAASISTMLSKNRVTEFPEWADWLIATLLCFFFVWATFLFKKYDWGDCVMRVIQITFLLLIIVLGTIAYVDWRLNINFTRPLLMVGLGALAVDLWNGGKGIYDVVLSKIKTKKDN